MLWNSFGCFLETTRNLEESDFCLKLEVSASVGTWDDGTLTILTECISLI
jgi:hypothetical protein